MATKFFKATLSAKKSHPENPADIVHYSDEYSTAKDYADAIKETLNSEDVNAAFWFAPKIERITEQEFSDNRFIIEDGEEVDEVDELSANQPAKPRSDDEHYWFQYTKESPIIVRLEKDKAGIIASYMFESDIFTEIDKYFEKKENAIVWALGEVINDCLAEPSENHKAVIKGIGGRNSETAISDALMSESDVLSFFAIKSDDENKFSTFENNDRIEYKAIYSAIVDVISEYKGEQMPSAADCYRCLLECVITHVSPDVFNEKAVANAILLIKNPWNFVNQTSVTQIVMNAHPEKERCDTSRARLASKFAEDNQPVSDTAQRIVFCPSEDSKVFIELSGPNFGNVKYNIRVKGIDEKGKAELGNKLDALIFAINSIKGHLINHLNIGLVNSIINKAKADPVAWFDSLIDDSIPCEKTRTENTNQCAVQPESLPVAEEIKRVKARFDELWPSQPGNDFVAEIPLDATDDLGFDFDDKKSELDEMIERNFGNSEDKPEKSDFEKLIESYNEKIEALGVGEVIVFDDMPNAIYHAVVGVSSSKIKDAMKSLMYFNSKHNTKEIEQEIGAQFDIGNVFHSICLEPDLTSKEYIKEPSGDGTPPKPTQPQIDKYNEWRKLGSPEKSENPKAWPTDLMFERVGFWNDFYESSNGLYPVAAQDWELAESMVDSAMNDSDSSKILKHPSRRCEVSYFKRCDTTGMIIKARPDLELGRIIADLKSIALRGNFDEKYLLTALRKEVFNRGYHISAAMYLDITGKDQFLWIFTNKQKGYHWTATIKASSEVLETGREIYTEYKQKIADAYNSESWTKPESIQSKRNTSGKIELPEI